MVAKTAVIGVICILLCFNLNYTFPFHRKSSKWHLFSGNHTKFCAKSSHDRGIIDRTKNMALDGIENALKIVKDTHKDTRERKNPKIHDEDLSHYEHMVIMKKNPFLDLREIEQKLYNLASLKQIRQSIPVYVGGEPSLCSVSGEGPYVEISNRGLSGFFIPSKLYKSADTEGKDKALQSDSEVMRIIKKSDHDTTLLNNLEKDVMEFKENKEHNT